MKNEDSTTRRQKQILDLLYEGLTSAQIGERLCISKKTVDQHIANLFSLYKVNKRIKLLKATRGGGVL